MTVKQTLILCTALVAFVAIKAAQAESSYQNTWIDCELMGLSDQTGWERSSHDP